MHCSTEQVSAYVMVRCFNKENERRRKKKEKQMVRCVYFIQQLPSFAIAFFSTCLSIYSALSIHLSFFLYQLTDTKMTFYSQAWYFCVNSFCVFYVYSNLRIQKDNQFNQWFHLKCILVVLLSLMLFVKYVEDGFTIKIDCIALKRCLSNETMDHLSRFCI